MWISMLFKQFCSLIWDFTWNRDSLNRYFIVTIPWLPLKFSREEQQLWCVVEQRRINLKTSAIATSLRIFNSFLFAAFQLLSRVTAVGARCTNFLIWRLPLRGEEQRRRPTSPFSAKRIKTTIRNSARKSPPTIWARKAFPFWPRITNVSQTSEKEKRFGTSICVEKVRISCGTAGLW